MNDRQLNDLVRMAVELEEFEAAVRAGEDATSHAAPARVEIAPTLRLHGASRRAPDFRRWAIVGSALAAAAALTLVIMIPFSSGSRVTPGGPGVPIAGGDGPVVPGPSAEVNATEFATNSTPVEHIKPVVGVVEPSPCVVLAIFRDALGAVGCVQWQPHDLNGGRQLSDVGAGELLGISFGPPCINNADRLLLVALSGPSASLPATDESAHALASCLVDSRNPCNEDAAAYALAASQCLPANVACKVESMAMRPR